MTDAPTSRKTHVIRILGTNKNGDVVSNIWADVERIDTARSVKSDGDWQGVVRNLKWFDDPDGPGGVVDPRTRDGEEVGSGSRDVVTIKVCDPSSPDLSDPDEYIQIDVIKHMRSLSGDQGVMDKFINQEVTEARIVQKRRIIHKDTSIDTDAQAAFDADPTRKVYVVPGDQYTFTDGTDDDSQYIEQEVVTALKDLHNIDSKTGSGDDQGAQTKLLNQYIIDQTTEAQLNELGENGFNPPYRLDPFQTIINISLTKPSPKWGVFFGSRTTDNVVFARVNDDSGLLELFSVAGGGASGYTEAQATIDPSVTYLPGEISQVPASVSISYKGIAQITANGGVFTDYLDVTSIDTTTNETSYINVIDGSSSNLTAFNGDPVINEKGVSKNGLWATAQYVSAYNGDTLLWRYTIQVLEVLSGRRVLGFDPNNDSLYGVYTFDANGVVTNFLSIGDPSETIGDTRSNGDTFVYFNGDDNSTTIRCVDKSGVQKWSVEYDSISETPFEIPFRRSLCVVEGRKTAFVLLADQNDTYGDVADGSLPFFDQFMVALDCDSGTEVLRRPWDTNVFHYTAEFKDDAGDIGTYQLGTNVRFGALVPFSSTRFPQPP